MPLAMIAIEDDLEAIEAAIWLLTRGPAYLIRPQRGSRANHPTTPIIVALNNRARILKREVDNMPRGANWTAVHGPN